MKVDPGKILAWLQDEMEWLSCTFVGLSNTEGGQQFTPKKKKTAAWNKSWDAINMQMNCTQLDASGR